MKHLITCILIIVAFHLNAQNINTDKIYTSIEAKGPFSDTESLSVFNYKHLAWYYNDTVMPPKSPDIPSSYWDNQIDGDTIVFDSNDITLTDSLAIITDKYQSKIHLIDLKNDYKLVKSISGKGGYKSVRFETDKRYKFGFGKTYVNDTIAYTECFIEHYFTEYDSLTNTNLSSYTGGPGHIKWNIRSLAIINVYSFRINDTAILNELNIRRVDFAVKDDLIFLNFYLRQEDANRRKDVIEKLAANMLSFSAPVDSFNKEQLSYISKYTSDSTSNFISVFKAVNDSSYSYRYPDTYRYHDTLNVNLIGRYNDVVYAGINNQFLRYPYTAFKHQPYIINYETGARKAIHPYVDDYLIEYDYKNYITQYVRYNYNYTFLCSYNSKKENRLYTIVEYKNNYYYDVFDGSTLKHLSHKQLVDENGIALKKGNTKLGFNHDYTLQEMINEHKVFIMVKDDIYILSLKAEE